MGHGTEGLTPCCRATRTLKTNHRSAKFRVDQVPISLFPFLLERDLEQSSDASAPHRVRYQ